MSKSAGHIANHLPSMSTAALPAARGSYTTAAGYPCRRFFPIPKGAT
jgi:hypothetical protein